MMILEPVSGAKGQNVLIRRPQVSLIPATELSIEGYILREMKVMLQEEGIADAREIRLSITTIMINNIFVPQKNCIGK